MSSLDEFASTFVRHLAAGDPWSIVIRPYKNVFRDGNLAFILSFFHDGVTYELDSTLFVQLGQPFKGIGQALAVIGALCDPITVRDFSSETSNFNDGLGVLVSSLALVAEFAVAEAIGSIPRLWMYEVDYSIGDDDDTYGGERSTFTFTLE